SYVIQGSLAVPIRSINEDATFLITIDFESHTKTTAATRFQRCCRLVSNKCQKITFSAGPISEVDNGKTVIEHTTLARGEPNEILFDAAGNVDEPLVQTEQTSIRRIRPRREIASPLDRRWYQPTRNKALVSDTNTIGTAVVATRFFVRGV